jgi:Na+/phosphate symporter
MKILNKKLKAYTEGFVIGAALTSQINSIPAGVKGIGSLGLFMCGMNSISKGFGQLIGKKSKLIDKASKNSAASLATGGAFGALDVPDEVVLGLLDSGIISLKSSLQMNIGRSIAQPIKNVLPWLGMATASLAIPDDALSIMMLAKLGSLHKNEKVKGASNIVSGLGMAATGMDILKDVLVNSVDKDFLTAIITKIEQPVPAALFGAGVMCVMMKSSVLNSVMAPFLNSGLMPIQQAFAVNVGQIATGGMDTALESISLGRNAKRLALGRLLIGGTGMAIYLTAVSANPGIATGIHELISAVPAFNNPAVENSVFMTLHSLLTFGLSIPFINPLVKLLNKVIPAENPHKESKLAKIIDRFKMKIYH